MVEEPAPRDVTAWVSRVVLLCIGQHGGIVSKADFACARITHQEIATMVSSVRVVVQRALKQLERDGAVVLKRSRIDTYDPQKLER